MQHEVVSPTRRQSVEHVHLVGRRDLASLAPGAASVDLPAHVRVAADVVEALADAASEVSPTEQSLTDDDHFVGCAARLERVLLAVLEHRAVGRGRTGPNAAR